MPLKKYTFLKRDFQEDPQLVKMTRGRRNPKPTLDFLIKRKEDEHFALVKIDEIIGFGVFAKKEFEKGDFLLKYKGEFISNEEAERRSLDYQTKNDGCFIYYNLKDTYGKTKCLDATNIHGMGKIVNDSPEMHANSIMKREVFGNNVHLCLFAKQHINNGTEIRYDYGEVEEYMPWRKMEFYMKPRSLFESQIPHQSTANKVDQLISNGCDQPPTNESDQPTPNEPSRLTANGFDQQKPKGHDQPKQNGFDQLTSIEADPLTPVEFNKCTSKYCDQPTPNRPDQPTLNGYVKPTPNGPNQPITNGPDQQTPNGFDQIISIAPDQPTPNGSDKQKLTRLDQPKPNQFDYLTSIKTDQPTPDRFDQSISNYCDQPTPNDGPDQPTPNELVQSTPNGPDQPTPNEPVQPTPNGYVKPTPNGFDQIISIAPDQPTPNGSDKQKLTRLDQPKPNQFDYLTSIKTDQPTPDRFDQSISNYCDQPTPNDGPDQPTPNELVQSTPNGPDQPTPNEPVQPTPNGYVKPTPNGSNQPSPNGPDQPTPNGPVQPTPNGYVQPTPNGYVKPTPNASDKPTPNGYVQPTLNGPNQPTSNGYLQPTPNEPVQPIPNGYVKPTPNGSNQPSLNGPDQPTSNGYVKPTPNGYLKPTSNASDQPTPNEPVQPTMNDGPVQPTPNGYVKQTPNASDQSTPNGPVQSTPNASDQSTPNGPVQPTPNEPVQPTPNASDQQTPNTSDQPTPNEPVQPTPNASDQQTPNTSDQQTPNTSDQPTPNASVQTTPNEPVQPSPNSVDQPTPNGPVQTTTYGPVQPTPNASDKSTSIQIPDFLSDSEEEDFPLLTKLPGISTTLPHTEINILNFTLKGSYEPKSDEFDQLAQNGCDQLTSNEFDQWECNQSSQIYCPKKGCENDFLNGVHHASKSSPIHEVQFEDNFNNEEFSDTSINLTLPVNDSGLEIEKTLEVIDSDVENDDAPTNQPTYQIASVKYKKPKRPCFICNSLQSRLKRHLLSKHSEHPTVIPLLSMKEKDKDRYISDFRKKGIRDFNMKMIESGKNEFMRERMPTENSSVPVMCSGCKGFFSKGYKARHQRICPAAGNNLMMPMVEVRKVDDIKEYNPDFLALLNTLQLDDVGNCIKSDRIILMIGNRSFAALKRKKDKITETKKSVRARMRLTARLYLTFKDLAKKQSTVVLDDEQGNASDMYRREAIGLLTETINTLTDKPSNDNEGKSASLTDQKSGLKITIFNLIKLTAKYLIGHYLVLNEDDKSKRIVDFLQVLKMFQEDMFGDAYYDLNYRKNTVSRKPQNLPKEDDVKLLNAECIRIMNSIDVFDMPSESFVSIRSATATFLIIFNARRGGEPVRLNLYQWKEALDGVWDDEEKNEENSEVLVTFQTGKGGDHLVAVYFPPECFKAMKFLTDEKTRSEAGVLSSNEFIFASTQKSTSHADGWHCINDILKKLSLEGAINATRNRHRVASLLASLQLSEKEQQLIFKHFGHSAAMNENVYQSASGTLQKNTTGKQLMQLHTQTTANKSPQATKIVDTSETVEKEIEETLEEVPRLTNNQNSSSKFAKPSCTKSNPKPSKIRKLESKPARIESCKLTKSNPKSSNKRKLESKRYPTRMGRKKKIDVRKSNLNTEDEDSEDEDDGDADFVASTLSDSGSSGEDVGVVMKCQVSGSHQVKKDASKGRSYFQWNDKSKSVFQLRFGEYVCKDRGYPGRKEMERFADEHGCTYLQVRTRIINLRRQRVETKGKLRNEMGLF